MTSPKHDKYHLIMTAVGQLLIEIFHASDKSRAMIGDKLFAKCEGVYAPIP